MARWQHYAAVKERLVAGVQADGTAIVGVDDEWCAAAADRIAARRQAAWCASRCAGRCPTAFMSTASTIMQAAGGSARPIARLGGIGSLRGVHNAQNAACAAGAALALGLSLDARSSRACESFPGLAHRMEQVGRKGRVLFVNDSKATNADSAAQALACFADIFWIAGGKPKTGGIASLARLFPAHPQGLSDRRGGGRVRGRARGQGAPRDRRHARAGGRARGARRRGVRARPSRWCCCRRPAPRSTSTGISRCAARR